MSMRSGKTSIWAWLIVIAPRLAFGQEPTITLVETFDHFLARNIKNDPEDGDLDGRVWRVEPPETKLQGPLKFTAYDDMPISRGVDLPPGIYSIREKRGAALVMKPGSEHDIDLVMRVPLPSPTRKLFVQYRAFVPKAMLLLAEASPQVSSPKRLQHSTGQRVEAQGSTTPNVSRVAARLEFAWSKDGLTYAEVPRGCITFDSDGNVSQAAPLLTIDAPEALAGVLYLRWRTRRSETALVGLDDISISDKRRKTVVSLQVDSPPKDEMFFRTALQRELERYAIPVATCDEDTRLETSTAHVLAERGITSREGEPRVEILSRMTRGGCHTPPVSQFLQAHLVAHVDERSGAREVILRLRNLDDPAQTPAFATAAEPSKSRLSWGTLVEKVVAKALAAPMAPAVSVEPEAYVSVGSRLDLLAEIRGANLVAPQWRLLRCFSRESCDAFQRRLESFERCRRAKEDRSPSDVTPEPVCAPLVGWGATEVGFVASAILPETGFALDINSRKFVYTGAPGEYVLTVSVEDQSHQRHAFAMQRLHVEPLRTLVHESVGLASSPTGIAAVLGYYRRIWSFTDISRDGRGAPMLGAGLELYLASGHEKTWSGLVGPSAVLLQSVFWSLLTLDVTVTPGLWFQLNQHERNDAAFGIGTSLGLTLDPSVCGGHSWGWPPVGLGLRLGSFYHFDSDHSARFLPMLSGSLWW